MTWTTRCWSMRVVLCALAWLTECAPRCEQAMDASEESATDEPTECGVTCKVDGDCFSGWHCMQRGGAWQCVPPTSSDK